MLDCGVEKISTFVRSVRFNYSAHFVNFAVHFSSVDEVRELGVDELNRDSERLRHLLKGHTLVGFEVLAVCHESHLLRKVEDMVLEIFVFLDSVDDVHEGAEEIFVLAVIE